MKWVIGCKESLREHLVNAKDTTLVLLFDALNVAIMDLETELAFYEPANPPYARRDPAKQGYAPYEHKKNPTAKERLALKYPKISK